MPNPAFWTAMPENLQGKATTSRQIVFDRVPDEVEVGFREKLATLEVASAARQEHCIRH
jgi:hypothetical protein